MATLNKVGLAVLTAHVEGIFNRAAEYWVQYWVRYNNLGSDKHGGGVHGGGVHQRMRCVTSRWIGHHGAGRVYDGIPRKN